MQMVDLTPICYLFIYLLLFGWRYVFSSTRGENNLSHPFIQWKKAHPLVDPFSYWSINCSAKHSALRYSSWREDVSRAAEFQGQMGCRDVIEIKLVGWVAGTGRVETHWGDTQNTQGHRQWRWL